jgi:AcrR family transcriptional regulator
MVFVSTSLPPRPGRRSRITEIPREPLSRERIVDAAMAIVDAGGLDALSMRSVAQALDTGPASLYAHVDSKDDLLALLIDRVAEGIALPEPDPERWQEQVKAMVRDVHHGLLAHRDLARASLATIPLSPAALAFRDRMIAVLRGGGLPDRVVAYAVDLLPLYAVATAYEHGLYAQRMTTAEGERYIAEVGEYLRALPPERFPSITALAGPLVAGGHEGERFEFGLDVLVAGLAAYGRASSA